MGAVRFAVAVMRRHEVELWSTKSGRGVAWHASD